MIGTQYGNILLGMSAIAIALNGSQFVMSRFIGAKVRMSLAKFPVRITGVVHKQLLLNKPTNDFWPIVISKWY